MLSCTYNVSEETDVGFSVYIIMKMISHFSLQDHDDLLQSRGVNVYLLGGASCSDCGQVAAL